MERLNIQVEHQQIEWRRAKVLELSSQGRSQREIADIIHVGIGTVNRDLAYLSKQAQESLKTHIQERLLEEYQKCMAGINQVLKICWNIVNKDSTDEKIKLQAIAIINESYKYLMDLTTNRVVVTDANVKVCFLTASEMYHEEIRGVEHCALNKDLFLQKPISTDDLIREINNKINST
jgi:transcriptional regulator